MGWYTSLRDTFVHSARSENTNIPGRTIFKGKLRQALDAYDFTNILKGMLEFTTWTKTRMTRNCVRFSHRDRRVAIAVDAKERIPDSACNFFLLFAFGFCGFFMFRATITNILGIYVVTVQRCSKALAFVGYSFHHSTPSLRAYARMVATGISKGLCGILSVRIAAG